MPSGTLRTIVLSAALLSLGVVATPPCLAQVSARSAPPEALTRFFERYWDTITRVQSDRDLAAIEAKLDLILRQEVSFGNRYLQAFTQSKAQAEAGRRNAKALEDRIAAERSRVPPIDPEIGALEGVIAQTNAQIAELEGRQRRVVELQARLNAMPDVGFMDAAPRERLQAELAEARQQVPNPSEIARLNAQLQSYEAELQGIRMRQPVPDGAVLRKLEAQLAAARAEVERNEAEARRSRDQFQERRGEILAVGEAVSWLKQLIAFKRQALAAPTGVAPAQQLCQTTQGPFRCTGAFDGTWESVCTSDTQSRDSGHATVVFSPDGFVEARLQSNTPGGAPTTFVGPINAAGQVKGGGASGDSAEQWQGSFSLVSPVHTSGMKPIGGGTYAYALRNDSGSYLVRCSGTLKLL